MPSLNSRMPPPRERPSSGSFFGPTTMSAMTRTTMSSMGPIDGMVLLLVLVQVQRRPARCVLKVRGRRPESEGANPPCAMADSRTSRADSVRDRPATGRPEAGARAADGVVRGDRAEVARVLGDPAVVAHDEDGGRRHAHRAEVDAVLGLRVRVRLADRAAVHDE